jgi:hypothetical protein
VKLLSHERLERHSTRPAAAAADLSVEVQYDVGFAPADAVALESLIASTASRAADGGDITLPAATATGRAAFASAR